MAGFKRIIHGCDGNDANNALNWKFGGQRIKGEYTYEINRARTNRPWPPITQRSGDCLGWYKPGWSEYKIHGARWATSDHGQDTL